MRQNIGDQIRIIPSNNYPHWILDFKNQKASDKILQEIEEKVFGLRVDGSTLIENQKGLFANKRFKKG